jgi:hypothetical protein
LDRALDEARRIFKAQANVTLLPKSNGELVTTLDEPAPTAALEPRCNWDGFVDGLSAAGDYYQSQSLRAASVHDPTKSPITVFIVRDVLDKRGCSFGAFDDYVVVDPSGVYDDPAARNQSPNPWTLAHELGHACNLFHSGAGSSLMKSSATGRRDFLHHWQRVILRASHLTGGL